MRYSRPIVSITLALLVVGLVAHTASAGASPSAQALLKTLETQSGFFTPLRASIEVIHKGAWYGSEEARSPIDPIQRRTWSNVHFDGSALGVETRNYSAPADAGQSHHLRCRTVRHGNAYSQRIESNAGSDVRDIWGADASSATAAHMQWGLELLGMAHGSDTTLAALLLDNSEITVRPTRENVGGARCVVVDSIGQDNQWTVWLDTNAGGLPRRVVGEVLIHGAENVAQVLASTSIVLPAEEAATSQPSLRYTVTMEDVFIGKASGHYFLQRSRTKSAFTLASGKTYRTTDQALALSVEYGPGPETPRFLAMADLPVTRNHANGAVPAIDFNFQLLPELKATAVAAPPTLSFAQRIESLGRHFSVASLRKQNPTTLLLLSALVAIGINLAVYRASRGRHLAG